MHPPLPGTATNPPGDACFLPANLSLAKYRFRLLAKTRIQLPPYKGSAFHGGFGHSLKKIAPFYYEQIFEPGTNKSYPKPFVLLPSLDQGDSYRSEGKTGTKNRPCRSTNTVSLIILHLHWYIDNDLK